MTNTESLIARRTRQGFAEADSRRLLADLLAAHEGDNLAAALVYQGFATGAQADRFVSAR